jgi:uncharacterized membrane protein
VPKFRNGDLAGGISDGIDRIIRVADGESLPTPGQRQQNSGDLLRHVNPFNPFLLFAVVVAGGILRGLLGRLFGSLATGALVTALFWFAAASLALSVISGIIAFLVTMFSGAMISSGGMSSGGAWVGGGYSGGGRRRWIQRRRWQLWWRRRLWELVGMSIKRISKHLLANHARVRRAFSPKALVRIERVIKTSEAAHAGQIRFVVEGALDGAPLLRNQSARARALDIFSHLRIWDTAHNNGVLIYLLLADHDVEILADRGIDALVSSAGWQNICDMMEAEFKKGHFEAGVIEGIEAVSRHLVKHFPKHGCPMPPW